MNTRVLHFIKKKEDIDDKQLFLPHRGGDHISNVVVFSIKGTYVDVGMVPMYCDCAVCSVVVTVQLSF